MLGERYKLDHRAVIELNDLQMTYKSIVEQKVSSGRYRFESRNCVVCDGNDFESLSEKDRYGLYLPVVACRTCGLVQANPRMTKEGYDEFYDNEYRKLYVGSLMPTEMFFQRQYNHGNVIREFIEAIDGGRQYPLTGKFVVEIGTGAGGILQAFKDAGNTVFGTDLGSDYLEFGKKRGLDIHAGTIDEFLKLGRRADIIIYSHVLEHVLDPVDELNKVRSVLAEDGLLYLEVPGLKALTHSYRQDFLRSLQNAHTYYFSLDTLKNVAHKAGFLIVAGDEDIRSVFRPGKVQSYVSDYRASMAFLRYMEHQRFRGHFMLLCKRAVRRLFMRFVGFFGVTKLIKKWYYRMKYSS